LCRATFARPRKTWNAGLNRRKNDHRVMNPSETVPTLRTLIPDTGFRCAITVSVSDSSFPTPPKTYALRSISRSMYDGSRLQPAIVAPHRGSLEKGQGTHILSSHAASCSDRDMCETSVRAMDAITGRLDFVERTGHPTLNLLSNTWTPSCFTVPAFQPVILSCHLLNSNCCFGSSCDSEKGTYHDAN